MRVAIIKNGVVANVIISETVPGDGVDVTGKHVGIGYAYDGVKFTAPPKPEPVVDTRVSRLAFRNRFTIAEKVAIYTASETNVNIKIFLDDVAAAAYIDLSDQSLIAGVNYLEAEGIIGAGRAAEILTI